jgi:para-nitrobenzyl esterase
MNHPSCSKVKTGDLFFVPVLAAAVIAGSLAIAAGQQSVPSASGLLADPIRTDLGLVSGDTIGTAGKQVRIFRGIPYAAPPVTDLRWKPPQPAQPWKGVRKCDKFGPYAIQHTWTSAWMGEMKDDNMSEDCLHLNVLTPAKTAADHLPVIVWVHDGGLDAGSGNRPIYNLPYLPQHRVVLVTVSHRIGGIGLVAHPGLTAESPNHASGNYEFLDLIAALQWVKRNIAAFGGNPDCVTIIGQSGGGSKVAFLMTSPLAKGLFHRAIIEGSGIPGPEAVQSLAEAEAMGQKLATNLGAKNIAELRAKTWQEVRKFLPIPRKGGFDFSNHITVDGWSMLDAPLTLVSKGTWNAVPVMWGGGEKEAGVINNAITAAPGLLKGNPNLFIYMVTHLPSNWKNKPLVAFHGLELFYEFGGRDVPINKAAVLEMAKENATGPIPDDPGFDKTDDVLADNIMKIWARFAATGNPAIRGLVEWPAYKATPGEDKYLSIEVPFEVKSGYMGKKKN